MRKVGLVLLVLLFLAMGAWDISKSQQKGISQQEQVINPCR